MTAPSLALADTTTMLRRDVRHAVRFPMVTISGLLVPVLFLLLFDGVFGHALRAGLGSAVSGDCSPITRSASVRPARLAAATPVPAYPPAQPRPEAG